MTPVIPISYVGISLPRSRLWGEALRDDTKNGCEGDYVGISRSKCFFFFAHFWYGIGYGFGVKTYLSFQFQVNKKESMRI